MARPTWRESSDARNDFHLAYSTVSKILARSRGPDSSVKSSKPISSGEAADRNGACADEATCEISSSRYMSSGFQVNSKSPIMVANGAPPKRSEEHTSELKSLMRISYAGICL